MAVSSGYFDSVNGDRTYNAEQMSNYFDGLVSNGVYEMIGDRFNVTVQSGMALNVGSGRAIIQSHWVKNDTSQTITLDASNVQYPRIDAVCLRLDMDARAITLENKTGTPSANPVLPDITRNETVYELYLASVYIPAGASSPKSVTDLRPSSMCGWVTGIVKQVDTSDLFNQWQEAYTQQFADFDAYMNIKMQQFNTWFEHLTSQLIVDTTIVKHENVVAAVAGFDISFIGIPDYIIGEDVLLTFVNGKLISEGFDYEIFRYGSGYTPAIKLLGGKKFNSGEKIIYVVLKNVPGGNIKAPVNAIPVVNAYESGFVANAELIEEV